MSTRIFYAYDSNDKLNIENLKEASKLLLSGELVAFPTETVYGLGVDAYSDNIMKVYSAKGRPQDNPLICHIGDESQIQQCGNPSELAKKIFELFSPGPITVVIDKSDKISNAVTGGLSSVGVRIPENQVAREFLKICGVPVAAPSANTSKRPSPTRACDVLEDLNGKIAGIIDGGTCSVGIESTVVDARGEYPIILREGKITRDDFLKYFDKCEFAKSSDEKVRSPGVKYQHYSPKVEMFVHFGKDNKKVESFLLENATKKIALIGEDAFLNGISKKNNFSVFSMGTTPEEFMHNYYFFLRDLEKVCDIIVMQMPFESEGLKNRCEKSCGGKFI
ncbi:MAG: L-threonylcarbamoyladenylate synthase [Bacillota bacterium]